MLEPITQITNPDVSNHLGSLTPDFVNFMVSVTNRLSPQGLEHAKAMGAYWLNNFPMKEHLQIYDDSDVTKFVKVALGVIGVIAAGAILYGLNRFRNGENQSDGYLHTSSLSGDDGLDYEEPYSYGEQDLEQPAITFQPSPLLFDPLDEENWDTNDDIWD